jgi:hypothetical protein
MLESEIKVENNLDFIIDKEYQDGVLVKEYWKDGKKNGRG